MKRALCGLVLLSALVAAGQAAASIATANVPYLAWRGQLVKVVACDIPSPSTEPYSETVQSAASIEAWSGSVVSQPQFLAPAQLYADIDYDSTGELCVSTVLTAYQPGLAVVELSATEPGVGLLFKNQLLVVWMTLGSPVLVNLGGESTGDGLLALGGAGDVLKATLKGTFPLGDLGPPFPAGPPTMTLPDDWATLANLLAADPIGGASAPGSAAASWDIHDDTTASTDHVDGICGPASSLFDAVDTCLGGDIDGPFSRADGSVSATPARGPLRPAALRRVLARATASSMPATHRCPLRASTYPIDAAGIGSLEAVDKDVTYSRDGTGGSGVGNLFAPFYASFVPATAADPNYASGTHAGASNNYPGFLGSTEPRRLVPLLAHLGPRDRTGANACRDPLGDLYASPVGPRSVALYTDEHGEARIRFVPGVGLWLIPDANNRCDLGPVVGAPAPANSAQVTAQARYPGDPVLGAPSAVSTPIAFQRGGERAGFSLTCMPKPGFPSTRVCFAQVMDIFGSPIPNAQIRFRSSGIATPTIQPNGLALGGFNSVGQQIIDSDGVSATISTNSGGTAGVAVLETSGSPFQIVAEALGTRFSGSPGLARSVAFGAPPPPADADGDGVSDTVDADGGSGSAAPGSFVDAIAGLPNTVGSVVSAGGLSLHASDAADPSGVQITVGSEAAGPMVLSVCSPAYTVEFEAGTTGTITCGSVTVGNVTGGSVTVRVPGGQASVKFPTGTSGTVATAASGGATVTGVSGTGVTMTAGGIEAPVGAGGSTTLIVGGPGNDKLVGTAGDDVIVGKGGNDTIDGKGGNDTIVTGSGNDKVDGGAGNDTIDAGGGNNTIDGGGGNDKITTGAGNDNIAGGADNDTIDAGGGNNTLDAGGGNDAIVTGSGNDNITGGADNDTIDAGGGNNTIDGGGGNDTDHRRLRKRHHRRRSRRRQLPRGRRQQQGEELRDDDVAASPSPADRESPSGDSQSRQPLKPGTYGSRGYPPFCGAGLLVGERLRSAA